MRNQKDQEQTVASKGKTLVNKGKTLVNKGKILVNKGKIIQINRQNKRYKKM